VQSLVLIMVFLWRAISMIMVILWRAICCVEEKVFKNMNYFNFRGRSYKIIQNKTDLNHARSQQVHQDALWMWRSMIKLDQNFLMFWTLTRNWFEAHLHIMKQYGALSNVTKPYIMELVCRRKVILALEHQCSRHIKFLKILIYNFKNYEIKF
jgi:hypothetical protein